MARYQHLLRRTTGDAQPRQFAVLDCDWTTHREGRREHLSLSKWVAVGWQGQAGVYGPDVHREGTTQESFWKAMASRLARPGPLWLVGAHVLRSLALLGLWERLEQGSVYLSGDNHRDVAGRSGSAMPGVRDVYSQAECDGAGRAGGDVHDVRPKLAPDAVGGRARRRGARRHAPGSAVLEDPPTVLRLRLPGRPGECVVIDSRNHGIDVPDPSAPAAERVRQVSAWLRGAVSILVSEGLGSWRATAASQGWGAWRRMGMGEMVQCHAGPRALRLEEDCTHGGRCECYRLGLVHGPLWHLDIRSLYPWCVVDRPLPVACLGWEEQPTLDRLRRLADKHLCLAEVELETDEPACPYLDTARAATVWPVGRFVACLAGPELADAMSRNRVRRVLRLAYYRGATVLSQWAERLLSLRAAAEPDSLMRTWLKSLLAGGIGRLGARERRWEDRDCPLFHLPYEVFYVLRPDGLLDRWRSVAGRAQIEVSGGFAADSVPAAWAWICSLGRLRLLQILRCAGWEHVHYCDTDAVMVDRQGLDRLRSCGWIDPDRVGYLREVGVYEWVELNGLKNYRTPDKAVVAGLAKTDDSVVHKVAGQWVGVRCKGSIRSARRPAAAMVRVPYNPAGLYRHGVVGPTGRVSPHRIGGER